MNMATIAAWPIQIDDEGVAWIEGTTTKVIEVVINKLASGLHPEALQPELPHLSLAQVYAALAYYYAHQSELDAEIERRRRWVETMRAQEPEPLTRDDLRARLQRAG